MEAKLLSKRSEQKQIPEIRGASCLLRMKILYGKRHKGRAKFWIRSQPSRRLRALHSWGLSTLSVFDFSASAQRTSPPTEWRINDEEQLRPAKGHLSAINYWIAFRTRLVSHSHVLFESGYQNFQSPAVTP